MITDLPSTPHPIASPPAYVITSPKPTKGKEAELNVSKNIKIEACLHGLDKSTFPPDEDITDIELMLSFLAHELGIMLLKSPKVGKYYYQWKREHLGEVPNPNSEEGTIIRRILPNGYVFKFESLEDVPAQFLAYIRLMRISNIRMMKNFEDNPLDFGTDAKYSARIFSFPEMNEAVTDIQKIQKKTGSRSDQVKELGKYGEDIEKELKKLEEIANSDVSEDEKIKSLKEEVVKEVPLLITLYKEGKEDNFKHKLENLADLARKFKTPKKPKFIKVILDFSRLHNNDKSIGCKLTQIIEKIEIDDAGIACWIEKTLKGNGAEIFKGSDLKEFEKAELNNFISSLTYLLFGTEVARNPASLCIHCMMLELIKEGKLTWKEAFCEQKMPMSINKAVPASRVLHADYVTTFKYTYDRMLPQKSSPFKSLMKLEAKIFKDWLQLKGIDLDKPSNSEVNYIIELLKEIEKKLERIEKLLGINSPPRRKIPENLIGGEHLLKISKELNKIFRDWYGIDILHDGCSQNSLEQNIDNHKANDDKSNCLENSLNEEEVKFCNSIIYINPLLNDPHLSNLLSSAKTHFGMQGVNKLIDLGADPQKYEVFKKCRHEQAVKLFLRQEVNKSSSTNLTILDPQGRALNVNNDYLQKLYFQFLHYHETGELLETARFALAAGYTYEIETEPFLSGLLGLENLEDALNDETSTSIVDSLEFLFSTSEPLDNILPISDEKLQAQQDYYLQTGVAYETLADYLQLDPVADNDNNNEEEDIIHEYNSTTNRTNAEAPSLPLLSEEDLLKLNHQSLIFPFLSSDQ